MFGRQQYQIDHQLDAHIARVAILCGGAGMIWGYRASQSWLIAFASGALPTIIGLIVYGIVTVGSAKFVGRAFVEMRKLIDRWPETREAAHARDALTRIKKHALETHETHE
jgi:ABC-type protease/lipase transport system fused ATPase/permease subunit